MGRVRGKRGVRVRSMGMGRVSLFDLPHDGRAVGVRYLSDTLKDWGARLYGRQAPEAALPYDCTEGSPWKQPCPMAYTHQVTTYEINRQFLVALGNADLHHLGIECAQRHCSQ